MKNGMKNVKTKTKETNKKASINTQTRLENLQRLQNIYKEIEYIGKQGDLAVAFKDDTKRKAIFATFTDIAHNFKGIANSNDSEVLALFSEQEKRQITGTRNVSAHGSENVAINAAIKYVKFTLAPLKAKILAFVSGKAAANKAQKTKIKGQTKNKKSWNGVLFVAFVIAVSLGFVIFKMFSGLHFIAYMFMIVFLFVINVIVLTEKNEKITNENGLEHTNKNYDTINVNSLKQDFIHDPQYSSFAGNVYNEAYKNSHPNLF